MRLISEPNNFTKTKKLRDLFCRNKDKIIKPYLNKLKIKNPNNFYAILMSSLFGEEVYILNKYGVPNKNVFILERDKEVHNEILNCNHPDRKILKDLSTTSSSMPAHYGIFRAKTIAEQFDLIYLDFYGQPSTCHSNLLKNIFSLDFLKPHGIIILTFGKTRCCKSTRKINMSLLKDNPLVELPTEVYVKAALSESNYYNQNANIYSKKYLSNEGNNTEITYVTTFVEF